jgi:predicted RNA polymerase sigma factor
LEALNEIKPDMAFQPQEATRAHLLSKLHRLEEARVAYDTAISLTIEPATRAWLQAKRQALTEH